MEKFEPLYLKDQPYFEVIEINERFGESTLIPEAGMSSDKDLLEIPVPFANRIEFLSDFVKQSSKTQTLKDISMKVGISERQSAAMVKELGAMYFVNENNFEEYQPYTAEVIGDELEWQSAFDDLEEYISISTIEDYLGKSNQWVIDHTANLEIYPEYRQLNTDRMVLAYPKSTVLKLRTLILHFPPANDLYIMSEVEDMVGKSNVWINKMVGKYALSTSLRTSHITKRVTTHYFESTVQELKKLANDLPEPAGNRYTAHQMGALLKKSDKWINARLTSLGEELLIDSSRVEIHYTQEVFDALKAESLKFPEAGDWVTENEMVSILGRSIEWIRKRKEPYDDFSEIRLLKSNNRPCKHYPPEVLEMLKALN